MPSTISVSQRGGVEKYAQEIGRSHKNKASMCDSVLRCFLVRVFVWKVCSLSIFCNRCPLSAVCSALGSSEAALSALRSQRSVIESFRVTSLLSDTVLRLSCEPDESGSFLVCSWRICAGSAPVCSDHVSQCSDPVSFLSPHPVIYLCSAVKKLGRERCLLGRAWRLSG